MKIMSEDLYRNMSMKYGHIFQAGIGAEAIRLLLARIDLEKLEAELKEGILKHDRPRAEIREAVEDTALHEVPLLERHLPVLATIAHITPLIGLLGTVTGMVEAFQVIQETLTRSL